MFGTPRYSWITPILALVIPLCSQSATAPLAMADSITTSLDWLPDAELSLRGSNGYLLKVKGNDRRVNLTAVRRGQRADYTVRGEASAEGIEARFGGLGAVKVEFQSSGKVVRSEPLRECEGTTVTQYGIFTGTIEFRGENGYTKVRETQAAGLTRVSSPSSCPVAESPPLPAEVHSKASSRPHDSVLLGLRAKDRVLFFSAIDIRSPGEASFTDFDAGLFERRSQMRVFRSASVQGPLRAFRYNKALTLATVEPREPFNGNGTFRRVSGGTTSWSGSLTVSLPGAENVALTGSRIEASLAKYEPGLPEPPPD